MTYIDRDIKTIGKHVNNAKEKSKMTESENIITVSCPECENHFSFSRNVLDFDGGKGRNPIFLYRMREHGEDLLYRSRKGNPGSDFGVIFSFAIQ